MRRRNRNKKQVKIVIGTIVFLLLIMTAGYAAFSTNLTITAKGNIKDVTAAMQLKQKIVDSGDGLYLDNYEPSRYVYRGNAPDNYIKFGNEIWRIIAVEKDGALKIRTQESIGDFKFDDVGNRSFDNNSFCIGIDRYGCGIWSKVGSMLVDKFTSGVVTQDSSLKIYLNNEYWNGISSNDKKFIVDYVYNIGPVYHLDEGVKNIADSEKKYTWTGKVGLVNASDFFNSSLNEACRQSSPAQAWSDKALCTDSYLKNKTGTWSINSEVVENSNEGKWAGYIGDYDYLWSKPNIVAQVHPTLFLTADIKLSGSGAENDPYIIKQ